MASIPTSIYARWVAGLACLFAPTVSLAWFIFVPFGAIQRAMEIDPDTVTVSASDRALGKCGGFHVNQAQKGSTSAFPDSPPPPETPLAAFHKKMAEFAVNKTANTENVTKLASAYSARWSRVAGADRNANLAYGADLIKNCIASDIPWRLVDHASWEARLVERERQEAEAVRIRIEETQKQRRVEEEAKRAPMVQTGEPADVVAGDADLSAEARKSARILECISNDVRPIGVDGKNALFMASCESGASLVLTCDPAGLCLKR